MTPDASLNLTASDRDALRRRFSALILLVGLLSGASLVLAGLYFVRHPFLLQIIPDEGVFWEGRFPVITLSWLLLANVGMLLGLIGGLVLVQQKAVLEGFRAVRGWFEERSAGRGVYVGLVVLFALAYAAFRFVTNEEWEPVTLALLANGEALVPFQHRVLVPWTAALFHRIGLPLVGGYALVEGAAAILLFVAFEKYLATFFSNRWTSRLLSLTLVYPLFFIFLSPHRTNAFFFPWDTLSMALFTLGLLFLRQRRWAAYYLLFVVASFNRETTCFLTMVYFVTALLDKETYRVIIAQCAAQFVLWASIKALLIQLYPEAVLYAGEGQLFEDQVIRNVAFLANPLSYLYLLKVMGGIWLPVLFFFPLIGNAFARRVLLILVPFFVGMFIVGLLGEIRIYGELIPLFLVPFLLILRALAYHPIMASRPAPALQTEPTAAWGIRALRTQDDRLRPESGRIHVSDDSAF